MRPEEPEESYYGDPVAEEILRFYDYVQRIGDVYAPFEAKRSDDKTSLGYTIAEHFKKLGEVPAEDFVFLCQCGIVPDLSLD